MWLTTAVFKQIQTFLTKGITKYFTKYLPSPPEKCRNFGQLIVLSNSLIVQRTVTNTTKIIGYLNTSTFQRWSFKSKVTEIESFKFLSSFSRGGKGRIPLNNLSIEIPCIIELHRQFTTWLFFVFSSLFLSRLKPLTCAGGTTTFLLPFLYFVQFTPDNPSTLLTQVLYGIISRQIAHQQQHTTCSSEIYLGFGRIWSNDWSGLHFTFQ